jgi:hypothetical protein
MGGQKSLENIRVMEGLCHRVDRVLGFFSSRWNWDSHTRSPEGECAPPPLVPGGGGHTRLRERGGEGPNSDTGTYPTLWYSMYICTVLCGLCLRIVGNACFQLL